MTDTPNSSPLLSVVIPCYNERATVAELLRRVQEIPLDKEIIVKVNGAQKLNLAGLAGATTGNQDTLRAGIIGYAGTSGIQVAVLHSTLEPLP